MGKMGIRPAPTKATIDSEQLAKPMQLRREDNRLIALMAASIYAGESAGHLASGSLPDDQGLIEFSIDTAKEIYQQVKKEGAK